MRRRAGHRGFTVVETLVAGVILAAGAVVIGLSVRQGLRATELAGQYQAAAELLDQVMSKVDLIGPDAMLASGPAAGAFDAPNERFNWEVQVEVTDTTDLYQVTARIDWSRVDGSQAQVEAQTLMYDKPGSRPAGLEWDGL